MPRIRTKRFNPPKGWEIIEDFIDEMEEKMREAEAEPNEYKRRNELLWPVFQIHHQRSRYIYEMFYKTKKISRELYDFCIENNYADPLLIAKWKKPGYEKLCCLPCMKKEDHNFTTTCICRVPKDKLEAEKVVECTHCGCRGCASGD